MWQGMFNFAIPNGMFKVVPTAKFVLLQGNTKFGTKSNSGYTKIDTRFATTIEH